jgi:hypothetical protein
VTHGRSLCWHPVPPSENRRSGPESAGRGSRPRGEIIPEWWATSSRNGGRDHPGIGGRHHPGTTGGFPRNRHLNFVLSGIAVGGLSDCLPWALLFACKRCKPKKPQHRSDLLSRTPLRCDPTVRKSPAPLPSRSGRLAQGSITSRGCGRGGWPTCTRTSARKFASSPARAGKAAARQKSPASGRGLSSLHRGCRPCWERQKRRPTHSGQTNPGKQSGTSATQWPQRRRTRSCSQARQHSCQAAVISSGVHLRAACGALSSPRSANSESSLTSLPREPAQLAQ